MHNLMTENTSKVSRKKEAEKSGVRMPKDDKDSNGGDDDREDGEDLKDIVEDG